MSGELLLELHSEEIPARMQWRALDDLVALLKAKLDEAQIPAQSWRGYVTPRRLAVIAEGIPAQQPDRHEERRGPRVGAPPQAIEGFVRAAGIASIEQCEIRDTGRGEFYFAVIDRPGAPASEVLPGLIRDAIGALSWPKSMRYPASSLRWVRPLRSAICLFDGAVLPLALEGVPVGRTTRGHRFLSAGEITVESAADYVGRLEQACVVLDLDKRKETIAAGLDRLAAAEALTVKPDPGLLEEVAGLVEYPVPLIGAIDDDCMALPPEVLATAMRAHQKYFTALKPDGGPAPRFLFVANNETPDGGRTVVAGNERVLRARLADARFFWDQDRKTRLEDRVEALQQRVYHEKLGTVYDKVERMEGLAEYLANTLRKENGEGLAKRAQRAARLCKADLSTGMVGEFPELQGVMGRYYARHDEDEQVADAIADHYKPLGPGDTCPTAPVSVVVALADKLDSLVAFFAVDERPTGSRDPFALRRAALGVVRLIRENDLRLDLYEAFGAAHEELHKQQVAQQANDPGKPADLGSDPASDLMPFIAERLRVHLRERGARHDLVAAVFSLTGEGDIVRLLARVDALAAFLASDDGANLLVAYRRAANIVGIEEKRDNARYSGDVDAAKLVEPAEHALRARLGDMSAELASLLFAEKFDAAMALLAMLRAPVDEFFDKVTVNVQDQPELRVNRLRLLSRIRDTMNQVADFSRIEG